VVLAADVARELHGILTRRVDALGAAQAHLLEADMAGWLARVRVERWPGPTAEEVERLLPRVLPVLRHITDLRPVVTAIQAQPDWVISGHRVHWSAELGRYVGLRILSPQEFVQRLAPPR
jgi:hypothetical protein